MTLWLCSLDDLPSRGGAARPAMRRSLPWPAAAVALVAALACGPAVAQEALRPGADSPSAVRSAVPQERGNLSLKANSGYERGRDRTDTYQVNPELRYGLADGLELRLGGTYDWGTGSSTDRGGLTGGLRWRALEQQGWRPAVALLGEVTQPTGPGDEGVVTELTLITSHVTGRGPGNWGLHLNGGWLARPEPGEAERRNGYRFGAAVSHVVTPETFLLVAYAQETQDRGERDLSIVEAGFQRQLGGDVAFALVAGAGLNGDSPALRVRAGLSWSFQTGR